MYRFSPYSIGSFIGSRTESWEREGGRKEEKKGGSKAGRSRGGESTCVSFPILDMFPGTSVNSFSLEAILDIWSLYSQVSFWWLGAWTL